MSAFVAGEVAEIAEVLMKQADEAKALGVFRSLHKHRRIIGLNYRQLATVGAMSVVTGLGQAAVLLILVRLLTALTSETQVVSGSVGPLAAVDLTTSQLLLVGLALVLVLFAAEIVLARGLATLVANPQATAQRGIVNRYSQATFDAQVAMPRGDTHAVMVSLTAEASGVVGGIALGISSLANFGALVISAVVLSPMAAGAVLVGLVLIMAMIRPLNTLVHRYSGARTQVRRALSSRLLERLHLSRELRSFGVERVADQGVFLEIENLRMAERRVRFTSRMSSVVYRVGTLLLVLGMVAVIELTGAQNLAALTGSLLMLLRSLTYGQALQANYQSVLESAPAMEQLVAEMQRLDDSAESVESSEPAVQKIRSIVLEDVYFSYGGPDVLGGIDFQIEHGEFVALIGPSGAGKSTIMNLLLRLREPTSGSIVVDGIPMSEIPLGWWRERVAHVPQEPLLQAGTVADAIRFHRAGLSDEDVRLAARRAHIHEEIESWPNGYNTEVGQMGDKLSGGQRQRVSIARALVASPDLLLLDEPTSALDPGSEEMIAEALEEIRGDMIIVAIAHRLRTVQRANRVILIDEGQVVRNPPDDLDALRRFLGAPVAPESPAPS